MEGFGDAPADGGSNPFDTGFDDTPAPSGLDAFGGPAPPAAAPLDNGFAAFGAAPEAQPATAFAPAPAAASGGGAPPLDDDFFGGGGSGGGAPPPSNSNGGAAQAAFESPRFDDPRIEWNHKNQSLLAQRAQAEVKAKAEVVNKAKAFLDKQAKERAALLSKRKATNRELEKTSNVAAGAVPSGDKPWERVLSVITFNREDAKGSHVVKDTFKELSRFKAVLLSAKAANVPVSA